MQNCRITIKQDHATDGVMVYGHEYSANSSSSYAFGVCGTCVQFSVLLLFYAAASIRSFVCYVCIGGWKCLNDPMSNSRESIGVIFFLAQPKIFWIIIVANIGRIFIVFSQINCVIAIIIFADKRTNTHYVCFVSVPSSQTARSQVGIVYVP